VAGPPGIARRSALAYLALSAGVGGTRLARAEAPRKLRATDLKTVLVGKIAEFVRWPAAAGLSDVIRPFEMALLGESPLGPALATYYGDSAARIDGHRVFLRKAANLADVGTPHLLFVGESMEDAVHELVARLGNAPVLTIADSHGFAQRGIAINFYQVDSSVRFEVSRRALQRAGLQASYRLLSRARLIDDQQARR
jgi:hypothetical protein